MHYDVIIIGESLASRLCGALLAKNGLKVLTLEESDSPLPAWFFSCSTLEHQLEQLDARSCLAPPLHFQVLTEKTRLDINGTNPLEDELKREFSTKASDIKDFLDDLNKLGQRIEMMLLKTGGYPLSGIANRLKFAIANLQNKLVCNALSAPIFKQIDTIGNEEVRSTFNALFSALTIFPVERMTVAEGALLWCSAIRNRSVCSESLDELIKRRYQQFHGATEPLTHLKAIKSDGKRLTGIQLSNGTSCTADTYLLGNAQAINHLPKHIYQKIVPPSSSQVIRTSTLGYKIPPLLAERVIISRQDPLRLTLRGETNDRHAIIEATGKDMTPESIIEDLQRYFPFADISLLEETSPREGLPGGKTTSRQTFPGFNSLKISPNFYICDGSAASPGTSVTGEAIVAQSLFSHLTKKTRRT